MLPGFLFFLDASTMSKREQVSVVFLPHSQVINHCFLTSSHSGWLALATGPEHSIKKHQHDSNMISVLSTFCKARLILQKTFVLHFSLKMPLPLVRYLADMKRQSSWEVELRLVCTQSVFAACKS